MLYSIVPDLKMARFLAVSLLLLTQCGFILRGNAYENSSCHDCLPCPNNNYIKSACTNNQNNVCESCSTCASNEFVRQVCHKIYDTVCAVCKNCNQKDVWEAKPCTNVSDTICRNCAICEIGVSLVDVPCSKTMDTVCKNCTACQSNEYTKSPCDLVDDAICEQCNTCSVGSFAKVPCGGRHDNLCETCAVCDAFEFISSNCSSTTDNICTQCDVCDNEHFRAKDCSSHANAICIPCTICPLGSHISTKCSATLDSVCSVAVDDNTSTVQLKVSFKDRDTLGLLQIASSRANTFLAVASETIADMFGNAVYQVFSTNPLQASFVLESKLDYPFITRFDLDMQKGILNVTMSRLIKLQNASKKCLPEIAYCALNYSKFYLQSSLDDTAIKIQLTDTVLISHTQYEIDAFSVVSYFVFQISPQVLYKLKTESTIGISRDTSVLVFSTLGAITDIYFNPSNISKIVATDFILNSDPPTLFASNLSMSTGIIILTMTVRVKLSSINCSAFKLSNSMTGFPFVTLQNSPITYIFPSLSSFDITLKISSVQLKTIKYNRICVNSSNCFVFVDVLAFRSNGDINNAPTTLFTPLTYFTKDGIDPQLLHFSYFDANFGTLALEFDEPIDPVTFNTSSLVLYNAPPLFATLKYKINTPIVFFNLSVEDTVITIGLSLNDIGDIKTLSICRVKFSCGLFLAESFLKDTSGNKIKSSGTTLPTLDTNQLPTEYYPDLTSPKIISFDLDMNDLLLTIYFDEPVLLNPSTSNVLNLFQIQNDITPTEQQLLPQIGIVSRPGLTVSRALVYTLNGINAVSIQANRLLAKNSNNSFLKILANYAVDTAGVTGGIGGQDILANFNNEQILKVDKFIFDKLSPRFMEFSRYDAGNGLLVLSFSEPVDIDTISSKQLTLKSTAVSAVSTDSFYTLADKFQSVVYTNEADKRVIVVTLSTEDLKEIRLTLGLAVSFNSTFVILDHGFIADMAGNNITANITGFALFSRDSFIYPALPSLQKFQLNMNLGILTLFFNSVILASSIRTQEINIQNKASATNDISTLKLKLTNSSRVISTSNFAVEVLIGKSDMDQIKFVRNLAVSKDTTYITLSADFCTDLSIPAQSVIAIATLDAKNADVYIIDFTPPQVVSFTFSLDPCYIVLIFSEPVDFLTVEFSSLYIQLVSNTSSNQKRVNLEMFNYNTYNFSDASLAVSINIMQNSSDEVKSKYPLGMNNENTFLSIDASFIKDMSLNSNSLVSISSSNAQRALKTFGDSVQPKLLEFSVNMADSSSFDYDPIMSLSLTFSEYVNISSYVYSGLFFQNQDNISNTLSVGVSRSPSSITRSTLFYPPVITIFFTLTDTNKVKLQAQNNFYNNQINSFISVATNTFQDMAGNRLIQLNSLAAGPSTFLSDLSGPKLISMDFDMKLKTLSLFFDEPIDVSTLISTKITLSDGDFASGNSYQLHDSTTSTVVDGTVISILLSLSDTKNLQLLYPLCATNLTTFIELDTDVIKDMYGNNYQKSVPLNVSKFVYDLTQPQLLSFSIDMWEKKLKLNFDKPIKTSTVDVSQLGFQNSNIFNAQTTFFLLTNGVITPSILPGSFELEITLDKNDAMLLRLIPFLLDGINTSFITASNAFLTDLSGINFLAIKSSNAQIVSVFRHDGNRSKVSGFALDMRTNTLTLVFDAVVRPGSIIFSSITLQSFSLATVEHTFLEGIVLGTAHLGNVTIRFSQKAINDMETKHICLSKNTCYLRLKDSFIQDVYMQSALGLYDGIDTLKVSDFFPKITATLIDHIFLDINSSPFIARSGLLSFNLSESIFKNSVNITLISIQNADASGYYSLTDASSFVVISADPDNSRIEINIGSDDMDNIKKIGNLATNNQTFIHFSNAAFFNLFNIPVTEITKIVNILMFDNTAPELDSFSIIYTKLITVILTFSETVYLNSITNSNFLNLNDGMTNGSNYQLQKKFNTTLNGYNRVAALIISHEDANILKKLYPLWSSKDTSFLTIMPNFVKDTQGNNIDMVMHKPVSSFSSSIEKPTVEKFSVNFNTATVTIYCSETIKLSTFDPKLHVGFIYFGIAIELQQNAKFISALSDSDIIEFQLSNYDLNNFKTIIPKYPLALTATNLFMSVKSGLLKNMFNVANIEDNNILCLHLTADSIKPKLIAFSLDMDSGKLVVYFDEMIRSATLSADNFALRTDTAVSLLTINSSIPSSLNSGNSSLTFVIQIGVNDLNNIKAVNIGLNASDLFVYAPSGAIEDMSNNILSQISEPFAIKFNNTGSDFYPDVTPPQLLGFSVDLNSAELTLFFSETVLADSFNINGLTLQGLNISTSGDGATINQLMFSKLKDGINGPNIIISLDSRDLNSIKVNTIAFTSKENSFIAVSSLFITDVAGLAVQPTFFGVKASSYNLDKTMPQLLSFDLDMNTGKLTLTFSEIMKRSSFQRNLLALMSNSMGSNSNQQYRLRP